MKEITDNKPVNPLDEVDERNAYNRKNRKDGFDIVSFFFGDFKGLYYNPKYIKIAGNPLGSIILAMMLDLGHKNKWNEFSKFKNKSNHELYQEGTSWCEELLITEEEFDKAIENICYRLDSPNNKIKKEDAIIISSTSPSGVSSYLVNIELFYNKGGVYLKINM